MKGIGENLFAIHGSNSMGQAAKSAPNAWGSEIKKLGISSLSDHRKGIGHATQMFWAGTKTVGCGVMTCGKKNVMVVCQYYPPGNWVRTQMYQRGKILSDCGKGSNEIADRNSGLCIWS
ncbi:unnamed protein product [Strongylus vulgaris]|uniref:SCP domain-containing protein n=1 Tax=Strongylus vulgaris TaxID=40348 RepID=A0A3P7KCD3_STRVU|nr:unnamed protein product [Strongylus vulgaris]